MNSTLDQAIFKQKLLARTQRKNCHFMFWLGVAMLMIFYLTSAGLGLLGTWPWWSVPLTIVAFPLVIQLLCLATILSSGREIAHCPKCGEWWMQWSFLAQTVDEWDCCQKCGLAIAHVKASSENAL